MATNHAPDHNQDSDRRDPRLFLFVLIGFMLLFGVGYAGRLAKKAWLLAEAKRWEARIEHANQQRAALQAEADYVKSDAYVSEKAREELGLVQPGDEVMVVLESTPESPATPVTEKDASQSRPGQRETRANWHQWLDLFLPNAATAP